MRSIALAIQDDLERSRDRARIFHHEGDELPQYRAEFRVDSHVLPDDAPAVRRVQAREGVERLAQHRQCDVRGMADGRKTMQVRVPALVNFAWTCARSSRPRRRCVPGP